MPPMKFDNKLTIGIALNRIDSHRQNDEHFFCSNENELKPIHRNIRIIGAKTVRNNIVARMVCPYCSPYLWALKCFVQITPCILFITYALLFACDAVNQLANWKCKCDVEAILTTRHFDINLLNWSWTRLKQINQYYMHKTSLKVVSFIFNANRTSNPTYNARMSTK